MPKRQQYPVTAFMVTLMCAIALLVAAGLADSANRDDATSGNPPRTAEPVSR